MTAGQMKIAKSAVLTLAMLVAAGSHPAGVWKRDCRLYLSDCWRHCCAMSSDRFAGRDPGLLFLCSGIRSSLGGDSPEMAFLIGH